MTALDFTLSARVVTTLVYAFAAAINAAVLYRGIRLRRVGGNVAYLYPACVMLSAASAVVARYFFIHSHLPFSFLDAVSFIIAPLMAYTGLQAVPRIMEMERERDA